jgi:hypothetical protein
MKLSARHYGIILFGLGTALLHLSLFPQLGLDPIFLNGFGYLALLLAYFLPIAFLQKYHKLVWWLLVGYTLLTIILWFVLGDKTFPPQTSSGLTGYLAKTDEIFLLICLWLDRPFGQEAARA